MAKVAPDYTFVRRGIPLSEWLWRVLSEERAERVPAAAALHAMSWGFPDGDHDFRVFDPLPDIAGQAARFKQAVRDVVNAPEFDTAGFVGRLSAFILAKTDERIRQIDTEWSGRSSMDQQFERLADRLNKQIDETIDDARREVLEKRLSRIVQASIDIDCKAIRQQSIGDEGPYPPTFMAHQIFNALDDSFLAAPKELMRLLDHRHEASYAIKALARIGPQAISFAPALIGWLDRLSESDDDPARPYDAAEALAAIGKDNVEIVDAMIERLSSPNAAIRAGAARTLSCMDERVAGRTLAILPLLHAMLDRGGDDLWSVIDALASVGRRDAASRRRIVDLARPRPPRWSEPYHDIYRQDLTMSERGMAIDAMRYFVDYRDECLPVLIDAIGSFEEYDPDETYGGPIGRVSRAIGRFGPRGFGAAAIALGRHLDDEEDFPKAILSALEAIGPAARDVLPLLGQFRRKRAGDESLADLDAGEVDKDLDPVGWLIQHVRRVESTGN